MSDQSSNDDFQSSEDWDTYLTVFLEESDEDLESLTQALLRLEQEPQNGESLNEAFRLLHTHKGSAGLMGFEGISELAHQLENRFEKYRSGTESLDPNRVTILLKCVDFLKEFNAGLKAGQQPNQDASALIDQLGEVEKTTDEASQATSQKAMEASSLPSIHGGYHIVVEFEDGLQLADMKARLIVARLANVGEVIATDPPIDDMQSIDELPQFSLVLLSDQHPRELEDIANVDGVKSISLLGHGQANEEAAVEPSDAVSIDEAKPEQSEVHQEEVPPLVPAAKTEEQFSTPSSTDDNSKPASSSVTETVRVGIDRLDKLMNLTGELVVTQARLSQLVKDLSYAYKSTISSHSADELGSQIRSSFLKLVDYLANRDVGLNGCEEILKQFRLGLETIEESFESWEAARRQFVQVAETADQLSRVSDNLQQSVLDTRMVPVAPLFNRFRRVIRDLAEERQKQVKLVIRGEKTELDKRMIDELSDPLLHLVRNSIDHGLEQPEERRSHGKPDIGQIVLEASHRGNNVFITISDDGRGLDLDKIRKKIVDRQLASESAVVGMSDKQLTEFIWQPGFSTSQAVTDISGRGVGMDVVKSRISELNGTVEVSTEKNRGTKFTLRLPLTLAIIRSLLVRFRDVCFSIPIAEVLETAAVNNSQIQSAYGRELIDLRGNIIPLIRINQVFYWGSSHPADDASQVEVSNNGSEVRVVIIQISGQTVGLVVDELLGSADIVIKSLADNFLPVRGLSGASIMGDGTVCLMIDTSEVIKMAANNSSSDSSST